MNDFRALVEAHVARFIPDLTPAQRDYVRCMILEYARRYRMQAWDGWHFSSLEQAMRDTAHNAELLNWDWTPIIATEQTMLYANCFLAEQMQPGQKVKCPAHSHACRL